MERFPYGMSIIAGKRYGKMWMPYPEWCVKGSFKVSRPSKNYPFSYIDHFFSKKYFKLVQKEAPELISLMMKKILCGDITTESFEDWRAGIMSKKLDRIKEDIKYFEGRINNLLATKEHLMDEIEELKKQLPQYQLKQDTYWTSDGTTPKRKVNLKIEP